MALDTKSLHDDANFGAEPPNFSDVLEVLDEMRTIAGWGENWDGEGGRSYSEATLERACAFLVRCAREIWQKHGRVMPLPDVGPGPNGSIDFHWKTDERELLLNMSAEEAEMLDFYGDTINGEAIKGKVYPSTVGPWLLAWLTQ